MIGSYRSMLDALDAYREMEDTLNAMTERPRLSVVPPRPKGHISVENVTYTVEGMDWPILSNVSFEDAAGEIVGGIGTSGAVRTRLATTRVGCEAPTPGHCRLPGHEHHARPYAKPGTRNTE